MPHFCKICQKPKPARKEAKTSKPTQKQTQTPHTKPQPPAQTKTHQLKQPTKPDEHNKSLLQTKKASAGGIFEVWLRGG
jgi:hypothetical protein